jgi:hypothetical protein
MNGVHICHQIPLEQPARVTSAADGRAGMYDQEMLGYITLGSRCGKDPAGSVAIDFRPSRCPTDASPTRARSMIVSPTLFLFHVIPSRIIDSGFSAVPYTHRDGLWPIDAYN